MRLGVLDIGSNTVHLLVADVRPGGRPLATTSQRTVLRLMRYLAPDGSITEEGVSALVAAVTEAREIAAAEKVDELLATATSAVREAANGPEVIGLIEGALGQPLQVLGGETEARYTFLAVRRWFGWAAGQILLFDIGGGSLEIAAGADELPEAAASVPLGAGRMTVQFLPEDPPGEAAVEKLRHHARKTLAPVAKSFGKLDRPDHVVGSSKAIRSLAKLVGYPVPGWSGIERMLPPGLARLVDSAPGTHSGLRPSGAAGDHPRPDVPDRGRRRGAARGDERDGRRRAGSVAVGPPRRGAAALHRIAQLERAERLIRGRRPMAATRRPTR